MHQAERKGGECSDGGAKEMMRGLRGKAIELLGRRKMKRGKWSARIEFDR
jgi:hypothetical protein